MQDELESRPYCVHSALQAELLMDRAWLRLLDVFTPEARGIADAARVLGVTTEWGCSSASGAWSALDCSPFRTPDHERAARCGGTVRYNRAQHLDLFETAIGRTFRRAPFDQDGWGFVTGRTPSGDVSFRIMREDGVRWAELGEAAPVMVSGWHLLHLSPGDARELQGELRALHERYARRTGEGPFLLGIFLADTSNVPGLEHACEDSGDA